MAVPTTVAAVPIVLAAGRTPVFRDEVATAQLATLPLGDLGRATDHVDAVVLPYLLLMKGWLALAGDSTLALRVPSVVAAVGLVAVLAVLGGRLAGPVGGVVAALTVGATPLVPKVAVLARPYAMAAFVALLALLVLHLALGSGHRGWWVAHAALVTASVLLQPFAVAALPAHVAVVTGTTARHPWRRLLAGWALALGAAALVAVGARGQRGQVGWIAEVGAGDAVEMVRDALSGPVAWLTVAGAVVGLVLVVTRRQAPWWWVGGALVLAPPLLLAVVSAVLQPAFVPRYLFLVPAGAALLAGGAAGAVADLLARPEPAGESSTPRTAAAVVLAGSLVVGVALVGATVACAPIRAGPRRPGPPTPTVHVGHGRGGGAAAGRPARRRAAGRLGRVRRRAGPGLGRRRPRGGAGRAGGERRPGRRHPGRHVDRPAAHDGGDGAPPAGSPARVVLLSLRSSAADRFVEAAAAGCTPGRRSPDRRLRDTRLWVLECGSTPAATRLSAAPDDPVR